MQVLKDELKHKILLEAQHLFLQSGYARTSMQQIADRVDISKGNLYHYFKNKEELFYELTDGAASGLRGIILRLRDKRFNLQTGAREYKVLLTEELLSLLLNEKYGLLLILEQSQGTRYEALKDSVTQMFAAKTAPLLADEDNADLISLMMAQNLVGGMTLIIKNRVRPREVRQNLNRLIEYHTNGINAMVRGAKVQDEPPLDAQAEVATEEDDQND